MKDFKEVKNFREVFPTADKLNPKGCRALAAAILLKAAEDLYTAGNNFPNDMHRVLEVNDFLHSSWYEQLTDMPYGDFIDRISEYWKSDKNYMTTVNKYRNRIRHTEPEPYSSLYYEPQMLRNILNNTNYAANWKFTGYQRKIAKPLEEV